MSFVTRGKNVITMFKESRHFPLIKNLASHGGRGKVKLTVASCSMCSKRMEKITQMAAPWMSGQRQLESSNFIGWFLASLWDVICFFPSFLLWNINPFLSCTYRDNLEKIWRRQEGEVQIKPNHFWTSFLFYLEAFGKDVSSSLCDRDLYWPPIAALIPHLGAVIVCLMCAGIQSGWKGWIWFWNFRILIPSWWMGGSDHKI